MVVKQMSSHLMLLRLYARTGGGNRQPHLKGGGRRRQSGARGDHVIDKHRPRGRQVQDPKMWPDPAVASYAGMRRSPQRSCQS